MLMLTQVYAILGKKDEVCIDSIQTLYYGRASRSTLLPMNNTSGMVSGLTYEKHAVYIMRRISSIKETYDSPYRSKLT